MNKKIIILVFIILLVINTTYWLNVTIKAIVLRPKILQQDEALRRIPIERKKLYDKYLLRIVPKSDSFTTVMIKDFARTGNYTMPLVFLAITDAVLIAISFMIILLYKKEGKKLKKLEN